MVTVERSSRVWRVERGREGIQKRVAHQKNHREGGQAKMGRTIEKHGSSEPQEERGDDGKTNDESGAAWGAGGELTGNLKLECA